MFKWIINVCSTVIGKPFTDWVRARIEERNTGLADRRDMNVEVDPEIMQVI